jgi:hypothetical protein
MYVVLKLHEYSSTYNFCCRSGLEINMDVVTWAPSGHAPVRDYDMNFHGTLILHTYMQIGFCNITGTLQYCP